MVKLPVNEVHQAGKVTKQGEGLWRLNVLPSPPETGGV